MQDPKEWSNENRDEAFEIFTIAAGIHGVDKNHARVVWKVCWTFCAWLAVFDFEEAKKRLREGISRAGILG